MKTNLTRLIIILFLNSFNNAGITQNLIDGDFTETILTNSKSEGHIKTLDSAKSLKYWKSPNQANLTLVKGETENHLILDARRIDWVEEKKLNYYEYAQVYFLEELEKDKIYKFSFEMKSSEIATVAHMDIQVYFGTKDIPKRIPTTLPLPVKYQLASNNLVTPALQFEYKNKWQAFDKYYKASGGEKYLIFGIFDLSQIQMTHLLGEKVGTPENPVNSSLLFRNLSLTKAPKTKSEITNDSTQNNSNIIDEPEIENIYFETGSAILTQESIIILDKLLIYLKKNKFFNLEIIGYTDAVGNFNFNQKLSKERADSAFLYLKNNGLDANRVLRIGKGEISSSSQIEEDEKNRCVIFKLIKK